jgi:hypothetical protein
MVGVWRRANRMRFAAGGEGAAAGKRLRLGVKE